MQIAGATHSALCLNKGIKRKNPHLYSLNVDLLALSKALREASNTLYLTEAIELPPAGGKVNIPQIPLHRLFARKRDMIRRHPVDRMKGGEHLEKAEEIIGVHAAGDIDVTGHERAPMHQSTQPTGDHKIDTSFGEQTGDSSELSHEI